MKTTLKIAFQWWDEDDPEVERAKFPLSVKG